MKDRVMRIITHDSRFHTDDVFAVATLILMLGEAEILRSRDPEIWKSADYLVDVGMQYDPSKKYFDHHQPGGAGQRPNNIPYASFGLVWKEYGEKLAGKNEAEMIDKKLAQGIDAHDNGIAIEKPLYGDLRIYNIGDFIDSYIVDYSPEGLYQSFVEAVSVAKVLLAREIVKAQKHAKDKDEIMKIYEATTDKRLIVFDQAFSGWKEYFKDKPEVLYTVHPRPDGKWTLATLQDGGYIPRKPLPKTWAGLTDGELEKITGVEGALFCHRNLFMAAASNKETAIKLAELALNA